MNNQQICPGGRKVIWCDKDRCLWRAGLCPPFRGSVCPFGGGIITYKAESAPVAVDAKAIAERFYRRKACEWTRKSQRKRREAGKR